MPAYTTLRTTHYIEGREPLVFAGDTSQPRTRSQRESQDYELMQFPVRQRKLREEYAAKDKARAKIKPIADPEEGKAKRRKAAARRRQRGRLGTMLTQREPLG